MGKVWSRSWSACAVMPLSSHTVDLVRAYSNRLDLANMLVTTSNQLRQAREQAGDSSESVHSAGRRDQAWRVSDRLSEADTRALIAAFAEGTPKRELARHYGVSESSLKRIIRRHRQSVD